jgi:hypothetical protein
MGFFATRTPVFGRLLSKSSLDFVIESVEKEYAHLDEQVRGDRQKDLYSHG